jgi:TIR domain
MAHDVFVSHSVKDKAVAEAIVARLEVTCWIAPRDVVPGADWGESIIDAIESSRIMILLFSQNANASPQIKREVERAVNKGVYIIPFRVEDIPPTRALEYFISTSQWMDAFSPPLERHLDNLAKTVRAVLKSPPLPGANVPAQPEKPSIPQPLTRPPSSRKSILIPVAVAILMIVAAAGWYLGHPHATSVVTPRVPSQSPRDLDVCASGYVWREARPADHVCVTPESRALIRQENSRAAQRWTVGAYGPHTCTQGYVWREAFKGDDVCVTPERRDQVREENRVASSRHASR